MPGPIGTDSNSPTPDKGTLQVARNPAPVPLGSAPSTAKEVLNLTKEEKLLAAVIYGEGSTANMFEEMAGIAAVLIRQAKARGQAVAGFLGSEEAKTFSFVLKDGNPRYNALIKASEVDIAADAGMKAAVKSARHAMSDKQDYSGGGFFWDGLDLKTNYTKHPKVLKGIRFTKKEQDIYSVGDHKISEVIKYWMKLDKEGKQIQGSERGRYDCTYESTAAYGGTVFWCYTPEFLKATGNKEYK